MTPSAPIRATSTRRTFSWLARNSVAAASEHRVMKLAMSLVLSVFGLFLFAALWSASLLVTDCPTWFQSIGLPCDIFIEVSYFVVCPMLSILAVIFSARDVLHKERRTQAAAAFFMSVALLVWFWRNPPH